jgi:hypothetical protein
MPTLTVEYTTEAERMELERAVAYLAEMRQLGSTAAHGTVMDACEKLALSAGRRLLRDNLKATVQARAGAQKKRRERVPRDDGTAT